MPNDSAEFGSVRNDSESFRNVPKVSERKENHTLTVREAARLFEAAGAARTERSIINWCQLNGQGVARLDAYFDPNERKYYITPQSVDLAIAEEKAKAAKVNTVSEPNGSIPYGSERDGNHDKQHRKGESDRIRELEREVMDLKITNRGKDYFIDQLKQQQQGMAEERKELVGQLMTVNRHLGELEMQLLQLGQPAAATDDASGDI